MRLALAAASVAASTRVFGFFAEVFESLAGDHPVEEYKIISLE